MIKYILCPGTVRSRTDGDVHYISATELAALYKVPLSQCIVIRDGRDWRGLNTDGMTELRPRFDGNYTL